IEHDQMPEIYRQNHFFLMSSAHEGMSNAMLEATASGLPIISTACEGTEELVAENGVIIQKSTPESFANAIIEVAKNSPQYDRMSELSRKTAEKFSWGASAQQYIDLYHTLAGT
ncbi:MAG: glycosyltransferase family 4 protein, partial [Planctomycetota bacterium]